ncbi:MAG: hypothetical protein F6J97_25560 [Leptolyngbya sp. SIO4C1]|nr:hypothetical protein [Leptolyngbya sp. SIO4C1]
MKPFKTQKHQRQVAKAAGNVVQAGRDYSQQHTVRVGIWISITLTAVLAIGAAVFIRMLSKENSGIELLIEPSVEQPAEQQRE